MKYVAYTTKGIHQIAEKEIHENIENSEVIYKSPKYTIFKGEDNLQRLLELKTVDDIQKLLEFKKHSGKPSETQVKDNLPIKNLKETFEYVKKFRDLKKEFSITLSRFKNPEIDRNQLRNQVIQRIEEETEWKFNREEHSNFDLRIHLEKQKTVYSIRLRKKPLYYRNYRLESVKASLRPTIAAGLIKLLDPKENGKVVDNFCGAATVMCEAYQQGFKPFGGDKKREAVKKAKKNLKRLNPTLEENVKKHKAGNTQWRSNKFDYAVSNMPWGNQLNLDKVKLYKNSIKEYRRILGKDPTIILLGNHKQLAEKHLKKNFPGLKTGSFKIGFQGQEPTASYAATKDSRIHEILD